MTTTLETVSGIQARIFHLPGRPPFMLAKDLAEIYGTTVKAINQAVKRNPNRFPERYVFRLTKMEEAERWSQNVTTSAGKRTDLENWVFTHGGANMLSGVLKSPIADRMAVLINDAFTAMELAAIRDALGAMARLRSDSIVKKPIYGRIKAALDQGQSFEDLFQSTNYTRLKLENAIKEMIGMKLIDRAPEGTQIGLFWSSAQQPQPMQEV